ncbi:uncharacterized protein EI90DRAFT_2887234, partial [Cantharellus anzutake]|uniref:uncharacterized protein n=1 Tax=Cantharellus anzutake TaxID=1750568 RepID=UPI001908A056
RYYIQPGDTLSGISLRFGFDGRKLARLNKLPPSTLNTTPHLLHTRQFLNLPSNISLPATPPLPPGEEERRARERTEKRFAFVTKEIDYRIAKAYVALAEQDDHSKSEVMAKEGGKSAGNVGSSLESRAVDAYLDDTEWEEEERRDGRGPFIQEFP